MAASLRSNLWSSATLDYGLKIQRAASLGTDAEMMSEIRATC